MRKSVLVIFLLLACSTLHSQVPGSFNTGAFKWYENLSEAKKAAKQKSKPLLVFYYLDGDADSKWYLTEGFEDKNVKKALKDFVGVKVNATKEQIMFNTYPVILFYSPAGKEILIERIIGKVESWEINSRLGMVLFKTTAASNSKFDKFVILTRNEYKSGEKISLKCKTIERGYCSVKVFDLKGNLVRILFRGVKKAEDLFSTDWDQKDAKGEQVASGNYLFVIELASFKDIAEVSIL